MIKKDLKCPQCGKTLLRLYGNALCAVKCTCGYRLDLKMKGYERAQENGIDKRYTY